MFKNTEDAIEFGKNASSKQVEQLKHLYHHFKTLSKNYRMKKDLDKAMFFAFKGQFCREALDEVK